MGKKKKERKQNKIKQQQEKEGQQQHQQQKTIFFYASFVASSLLKRKELFLFSFFFFSPFSLLKQNPLNVPTWFSATAQHTTHPPSDYPASNKDKKIMSGRVRINNLCVWEVCLGEWCVCVRVRCEGDGVGGISAQLSASPPILNGTPVE